MNITQGCIAFCGFLPVTYAQAEAASNEIFTPAISFGYLLKLLLVLVFVLAVFVVLARLVQRYHQRTGNSGEEIKVLSSLSVGSKEKVMLIKVGDEKLLIGATTTKLSLLRVVNIPQTANQPETGEFRHYLQQAGVMETESTP